MQAVQETCAEVALALSAVIYTAELLAVVAALAVNVFKQFGTTIAVLVSVCFGKETDSQCTLTIQDQPKAVGAVHQKKLKCAEV